MAFKINYLFEGNTKNKPEQNLAGSSRKLSREALLHVTHEERRKRQEQRLKFQSAEILQTHIRSYIVRKHVKEEQRRIFDSLENNLPLHTLMSKLLFFYNPKEDNSRLLTISIRLMNEHEGVLIHMEKDSSFCWLMKRFLHLSLKNLQVIDKDEILISLLFVFTNNPGVLEYLLKKDYFKYLRYYLETNVDQTDKTVELIQRPFNYLHQDNNYSDTVFLEFSSNFLRPVLTYNIKMLLPYLKSKLNEFIFKKLIDFLNKCFYFGESNNIFYCVLALEPNHFEPTVNYIQVLAKSSRNLHQLNVPYILIPDDSDDEEIVQSSEEQTLLSDYLHIINRPEKVRKWLHFLDCNMDSEEVLISFIHWCHHLLLTYKDAIRKYLLLYKLGLDGRFLNQLWSNIRTNYADQLQRRGLYQSSWGECHTSLSVFCNMFIFYTETLTDKENSDTSQTFSKQDLFYMCRLLKIIAKEVIDVAFPISRTSTINPTSEVQLLYKVSHYCLKTLYMLDLREQFCPDGFWTADKIFIPPDLTRHNYLFNSPFSSSRLYNQRDMDDEPMPPFSTIELRSLAVLEELPFLIPFNTRVLLLRDLCRNSLGENEYQRLHDILNDRVVTIRRTHLYEDAFEKISSKSDSDLKQRLRIQFINSIGLEEVGIDGGGIFKEFISEVLKTAFDPNRGFFLLTADNTLYPNPNVHLIVENFTDHYHFIGRLVGKALFENILVDLPLAEFFLAKLLVDRASAHYLKSLDPVLYKNLLYLRDFSGDISDLGLDFTIVNNDLGETKIVELKPNGRNIPVINENRLEYIQRLADFKLNIQLKKQCTAFRDGINSVVPIRWLQFFDHKELQIIIGGNNQDIDIDDLKTHTLYGGEFSEDHPTILMFWKVLRSFSDIQKKQLLKFVTSCSRPPLLGFKELNPQFCIQSSGIEHRMPTASTCLNLLKLPIFQEEYMLRNKLLEAIEQQAGFELS